MTPLGLRWLVAPDVHYAPAMAEPLTVAGILAATAAHTYYHLVGGAVHHRFGHFLERWREPSSIPDLARRVLAVKSAGGRFSGNRKR